MKKCEYWELKVGDLFSLNCPCVNTRTAGGNIIKIKGDKRIFKKEREGASAFINEYGEKCEPSSWRMYPYLNMPVWKVEEEVKPCQCGSWGDDA